MICAGEAPKFLITIKNSGDPGFMDSPYIDITGLEAFSIIFEFCRAVIREMLMATMLVISDAIIPKSWTLSEGVKDVKKLSI